MTARDHHAANRHTDRDASSGCSGHASNAEDPTTADSAEVTDCLVMPGNPVIKSQAEEAGLYRDYNGQRYWLCCATCGPLFDADPERYASTT
ncbi:YHS domain-containing protein [Nesterenkonia salmonea]|uniref:YHS domain-containing protein n=1 Tax=Nesterenkonia salmonea TaxID=1804987 RepID=A0A5R9B9X1_9MICC|nr:YHS domain-containing protein [Nesterenkonia salmonea]TLP93050.1 YHS domain-containing protein [Nesterenkonia salmonea]